MKKIIVGALLLAVSTNVFAMPEVKNSSTPMCQGNPTFVNDLLVSSRVSEAMLNGTWNPSDNTIRAIVTGTSKCQANSGWANTVHIYYCPKGVASKGEGVLIGTLNNKTSRALSVAPIILERCFATNPTPSKVDQLIAAFKKDGLSMTSSIDEFKVSAMKAGVVGVVLTWAFVSALISH